jgi:protein involved in polysaccharide export with SLBB domain
MQKILATVAVGVVLNLPSTLFGQPTELPVHPGDLITLRIVGAVRNGGLFNVDPTVTISEALAMAEGPTPQGQRDKVWVFRDGEIITTILGGDPD